MVKGNFWIVIVDPITNDRTQQGDFFGVKVNQQCVFWTSETGSDHYLEVCNFNFIGGQMSRIMSRITNFKNVVSSKEKIAPYII